MAQNMGIAALRGALERRFPQAQVSLEPARSSSSVTREVPRSRILVRPDPPPGRLRPGAVTEVVGSPGDGGTTWVLSGMAETLARHPTSYGLYVDLDGSFYPPAAVSLDVPLDRLLIVRTPDLATGLRAVELCLRGGAVRVATLDVPRGMPPLRLATYHRLRRRVREGGGALVVLAREPFVPADHRVNVDRSQVSF